MAMNEPLTSGLFRFRRSIACVAFAMLLGAAAHAQSDYPSRPIRMIVPNSTGSSVDLVARKLSERLSVTLGQPIVVINQAGAGGLVGSQSLAQSPKDGYTIGFVGNTHVIVPHLHAKLAYDPVKDIQAVAFVGTIPFVAVVPGSSPIRDLKDLIDRAKRNPGGVKMGSSGSGTALHLSGTQMQVLAGVEFLHVPYKGVAPLQLGILGGDLDFAMLTVGNAAPLVEQGRLRALGTSGANRASLMANVPTIAEAGLTGYDFESWLAVTAPSGIPLPALRRLNDEVRTAVAHPEIQRLFAQNAITSGFVGSDAAQKIVALDYERMARIVSKSGAKAD